jgi:hypothetical protein
MDDDVRLHTINMELDHTGPTSPYRSRRQRLNRERDRIIRRRRGRDPRWFAVGTKEGGIPVERMEDYVLKKEVVNILEILEV